MSRMLARFACICVTLTFAAAEIHAISPVAKVIELLSGMETKLTQEGEAKEAAFKAFVQLAEKRSSDLQYQITTEKSQIEELNAKISKAESSIQALATSIEDAQNSIAGNQADLQAATDVRVRERTDFQAAEKELQDTIDSIHRATAVLQKQKGTPALMQIQQAPILKALEVMVSASMIGEQDAKSLTSLLQSNDQDLDFQTPAAPAYEKKSGSIIELLENLLDKAKDQLNEARKKETQASHNFDMLAQSLKDSIKFSSSDLEKAKQNQANEAQIKALATKDLEKVTKSLAADETTLSDLQRDSRREASDAEMERKTRGEELQALGTAKEALQGKASGAALLQIFQSKRSTIRSSSDLAHFEVVRILRNLATSHDSKKLALLSRQVDALMLQDQEAGKSGAIDKKIIDMITGMIASMEKSLKEDTTKKAYCDQEMKKGASKKATKDQELETVRTKVDSATSASTQLKSEVADLQKTITTLQATRVNMTKLRQDEKALFEKTVPEVQAGLDGVKLALRTLRDYYRSASSAATGIIGMLEVVESDAAQNLAELRETEETAASDFEKEMQDLKLDVAQKEQDVKYKTLESTRIDSDLRDLNSDKEGLQTELSAIVEFNTGLEKDCTEPQISFEEKQAKRQEEINGLKGALEALQASTDSTKTSFLQKRRASRAVSLKP
jgi:chromosome segregation ATPase